ncbi:MAG: ABC transporter ATP-binding protein [Euryarchaeota archaeon]|nr:ABC transporter ATP-binding protein [Euryarchaeota archaeon]
MALMELKNVSKRYGDVVAVDGISLSIGEGEIFALLGPNGAGKSTLMRIIAEGIKHDGLVLYRGKPLKRRHCIGFCPQEGLIYEELSTLDNLRFYAMLHGMPRKKADELMERFSIPNKRAKHLSGGMQRRLAIAISIIGDPEFLILDEPTVGLDVESRREIWDIILHLKSEGKSVMLTTHYMEEAEALADRVAIINAGKIIACGTPEELKSQAGLKSAIEIRGKFDRTPPDFVEEEQCIVKYTENPKAELLNTVQSVVKFGTVREIRVREPTLEDVFLMLTGRGLAE